MSLKVLVACEESQVVTNELRKIGIEAYSCDILETSGDNPNWHFKQDVTSLLEGTWDMIIAFPPCTYLATTGNRWFDIEKYGEKAIQRHKDREKAVDFFMLFANNNCPKVAIENPVGVMSTRWRKPDCIVHPYWFGDAVEKRTCLWLKGLTPLTPTDMVKPQEKRRFKSGKVMSVWYDDTWDLPVKERARARSKTFPGLAKAMSQQWF